MFLCMHICEYVCVHVCEYFDAFFLAVDGGGFCTPVLSFYFSVQHGRVLNRVMQAAFMEEDK